MSSQSFKGSEISRLAKMKTPQKLTRSQTAKQALRAIKSKYDGVIVPGARYYHRGNGNWIKYSPTIDKKQTSSKVKTTKPKNYNANAHKYDVRGLDTKTAGAKALKAKQLSRTPKKEGIIKKLKSIGGKEWIKGEYHRIYVPNSVLHDLYGLKVSYYKTGNISSAFVDGEKISNTKAYKLRFGDVWYNVQTGKFETKGMSPEVKNKVIPKLKRKVGM